MHITKTTERRLLQVPRSSQVAAPQRQVHLQLERGDVRSMQVRAAGDLAYAGHEECNLGRYECGKSGNRRVGVEVNASSEPICDRFIGKRPATEGGIETWRT